GQFNTIIYTDNDVYRGQSRRDVVFMHPEDMQQSGLTKDMQVSLVSEAGRLDNLRVQPFDIRRGNLMTYFPEANVLVPRHVDPRSRTPAFKSVPVTLSTNTAP